MRMHFGRRRRSAGLVIRLQSDNNQSRLCQQQPHPEPTASFFIAPPRVLVQIPVRSNVKAFERPKAVRSSCYRMSPPL